MPLPPYIRRPDRPADRERYQTVFAAARGSVAAPTAGLHFTPEVLERCRAAGAEIAYVTLHVGLGTFQPLHTEIVERRTCIRNTTRSTSERRADSRGGAPDRRRHDQRAHARDARPVEAVRASAGEPIFIYPGFEFRAVDALLTNFHLPQSSLLMLVAAFAGRELVLAAYEHAVREALPLLFLRRRDVDPVSGATLKT